MLAPALSGVCSLSPRNPNEMKPLELMSVIYWASYLILSLWAKVTSFLINPPEERGEGDWCSESSSEAPHTRSFTQLRPKGETDTLGEQLWFCQCPKPSEWMSLSLCAHRDSQGHGRLHSSGWLQAPTQTFDFGSAHLTYTTFRSHFGLRWLLTHQSGLALVPSRRHY